ncbi:hypothetical protein STEG23_009897, partial [Scotinomys teguina]
DQVTMKYFIFTCLVAVALAKHVVKDQSIEKNAQDKDVIFQTVQESSEEINDKIVQTEKQKVNLNEQESINIIMKIKSNQIQQFNTPHFPQITHLQPIPATYWNIHKYYTSRYAPYM